MNEDIFNIEIRTYLKQVGVASQREIEHAILKAVEAGIINGDESIEVKMTLEIPALAFTFKVEGQIALE